MAFAQILESYRKRPYRNMFVTLLAAFCVDALTPNLFGEGTISSLVVVLVLTAALVETVRTKRHVAVALVLGGPAILSRGVAIFRHDSNAWNSTVIALTAVFVGFLIWSLLHDLLTGDRPISERIFGTLCAYLFIGMLFALVFAHIEFLTPGSFNLGNEALLQAASNEATLMPTFTYYSFVTLTTLGYGDITPVTEYARSLAWLEALIGQLYLAVMVATLVGLRVSEATSRAARRGAEAADDRSRDSASGD